VGHNEVQLGPRVGTLPLVGSKMGPVGVKDRNPKKVAEEI